MMNSLVAHMQRWVGLRESDGSYQVILDIYNGFKPLPRGHKMTAGEPWCAAAVSAAAIAAGLTAIVPPECSCNRMIALFKAAGEWQEDESVTPEPGWVLFYDWQDDGAGDNAGRADHVGVVEKVENGVITVIEGNLSGKVARRRLRVNGRYIRGYGVPPYPAETPTPAPRVRTYTVQKGDTPERIARRFAISPQALIAANIARYPAITMDFIRTGWVLDIPAAKVEEEAVAVRVKVLPANGLNIRRAPTTAASKCGVLSCGAVVTVLGVSTDGGWGMIQHGGSPGWICLAYTGKG